MMLDFAKYMDKPGILEATPPKDSGLLSFSASDDLLGDLVAALHDIDVAFSRTLYAYSGEGIVDRCSICRSYGDFLDR